MGQHNRTAQSKKPVKSGYQVGARVGLVEGDEGARLGRVVGLNRKMVVCVVCVIVMGVGRGR